MFIRQARRHHSTGSEDGPLNLLPFLDIIFAVIGIFIIVFAFQEIVEQQAGRALAVDHYVICDSDTDFRLHLNPQGEPETFSRYQFPAFFDRLTEAGGGIRNIVLAFTANCFELQGVFVQQFDRYTATLAQGQDSPTAYRLAVEPLAGGEEAGADILSRWRKETSE